MKLIVGVAFAIVRHVTLRAVNSIILREEADCEKKTCEEKHIVV